MNRCAASVRLPVPSCGRRARPRSGCGLTRWLVRVGVVATGISGREPQMTATWPHDQALGQNVEFVLAYRQVRLTIGNAR